MWLRSRSADPCTSRVVKTQDLTTKMAAQAPRGRASVEGRGGDAVAPAAGHAALLNRRRGKAAGLPQLRGDGAKHSVAAGAPEVCSSSSA